MRGKIGCSAILSAFIKLKRKDIGVTQKIAYTL
jgi:hypothetical protein